MSKGIRVGVKSGCFTLLHAGHVWCLEYAKANCDYLIVLTNEDEYLRNKKGNVPICLHDRLYILKQIRHVDEVGHFPEPTEERWIEDFARDRLKQEFGQNAQLVVFHSDELKGREKVPADQVADEIIFIDKVSRPESVSKIYDAIQKGGLDAGQQG